MKVKRIHIIYETEFDDIPEDIKELVNVGIYTKEECLCEVVDTIDFTLNNA